MRFRRPTPVLASAIVATVFLTYARPVQALNYLDYLDWACGGGKVSDSDMTKQLLTECGGQKQPRGGVTTCKALSGTPDACNSLSAGNETDSTCGGGSVVLAISGSTGSYLGWSVSGTLTARGAVAFTKSSSSCTAQPLSPVPTGGAGAFVQESGKAEVTAAFTASGTGSVTFLSVRVFSESVRKNCSDTTSVMFYEKSETLACEGGQKECCSDVDRSCCNAEEKPFELESNTDRLLSRD